MKKLGIVLNKVDMYISNDKEIEVKIETEKNLCVKVSINILYGSHNISPKRKIAIRILKYLKKLKGKEIDFSEKAVTNKYFYNLQEFFMVSAKFDCSLEDVKNKIENMFNSI